MEFISKTLSACPLFSALTGPEIETISAQARFRTLAYDAGEVVAFEEDPCTALGIVASGSIHIQRIYANGRLITIETFKASDSFGEALVFSDEGVYPATLIAKEATTVLYIDRVDIIQLCAAYPHFLDRFLRTLSNRILLLNSKIKSFSFQSIRQKVANYLLEERQRQKKERLTLTLARHELADSLGIPRPSLSRELIAMQDAGWIAFDRKTITILNHSALEQALLD